MSRRKRAIGQRAALGSSPMRQVAFLRRIGWALLMVALAVPASARPTDPTVRLRSTELNGDTIRVRVVVRSRKSVGAYSVNLSFDPKTVELVGVDGGDAPEFSARPTVAAGTPGRLQFGAFQTASTTGPTGRVNVATITLRRLRPKVGRLLRLRRATVVDTAARSHDMS